MQAQTRWALTAQQLRPPLDSAEFKARVIRACWQPGVSVVSVVSVASVAQANGLIASMLRRWVTEAGQGGPCGGQASGRCRRRRQPCTSAVSPAPATEGWPGFVAVQMPTPVDPACRVSAARHLHRTHTRANDDHHALASLPCRHLHELPARDAEVIRIDAVWLTVEPVAMRASADRLRASVVQVFGAARAHHGYLYANARPDPHQAIGA